MSRTKLDQAAIEVALAALNASAAAPWSAVDGKLHREFRFADFIDAFGFMAKAALVELGVIESAHVRLPLVESPPEHLDALRSALETLTTR